MAGRKRGGYSRALVKRVSDGIEGVFIESKGNLTKVAAEFGLKRVELRELIRDYPEVSVPFQAAEERWADELEELLFLITTGQARGNANAALKMLQALRPGKWKGVERVEVSGGAGYRPPTAEERKSVEDSATLTVLRGEFDGKAS